MSELYFEGSVTKAFEAGKRAGEYAARGEYLDVHCHDAALECLGQVNALTRHHDGPEPPPVPLMGSSPEAVGAKLAELCSQVHGADEAELSPATIALLIQIATLAVKLLDWWRNR